MGFLLFFSYGWHFCICGKVVKFMCPLLLKHVFVFFKTGCCCFPKYFCILYIGNLVSSYLFFHKELTTEGIVEVSGSNSCYNKQLEIIACGYWNKKISFHVRIMNWSPLFLNKDEQQKASAVSPVLSWETHGL